MGCKIACLGLLERVNEFTIVMVRSVYKDLAGPTFPLGRGALQFPIDR
jgi:hypothetical protein